MTAEIIWTLMEMAFIAIAALAISWWIIASVL
jgi:hypothetical protein